MRLTMHRGLITYAEAEKVLVRLYQRIGSEELPDIYVLYVSIPGK